MNEGEAVVCVCRYIYKYIYICLGMWMAVGDRCVYTYVCRVAVAGKNVEMRGR